jgi:DNA-directed RNA polymerase subunit RPC12/RpoP
MPTSSTDVTTCFACVDLHGADYRLVTLAPGTPLLRKGSVDAFDYFHTWLGDFVAEPHLSQQPVETEQTPHALLEYHLYNRQGARVSASYCRPLQPAELKSNSLMSWARASLQEKLGQVQAISPEPGTATVYHRLAEQSLARLLEEQYQHECGNYLLVCQCPGEPRKLVWCWAHTRHGDDTTKAKTYRCHNCKHLFLHRYRDAKQAAKCPNCHRQPRRQLPVWPMVLSACLLLILLLGGTYFLGWHSDKSPPATDHWPEPYIEGDMLLLVMATPDLAKTDYRSEVGAEINAFLKQHGDRVFLKTSFLITQDLKSSKSYRQVWNGTTSIRHKRTRLLHEEPMVKSFNQTLACVEPAIAVAHKQRDLRVVVIWTCENAPSQLSLGRAPLNLLPNTDLHLIALGTAPQNFQKAPIFDRWFGSSNWQAIESPQGNLQRLLDQLLPAEESTSP